MVQVESSPSMVDVEVFTDGGPWLMHNIPCSVCHEQKGVFNMGTGIIEPCWDCQREGFRTCRRRRGWLWRLLFGRWKAA